ncbi:unnamed protein product [Amaranthus hypochondriacus]
MAKSTHFTLLAICLMFFLVATIEMQVAEAKCGWFPMGCCIKDCAYKCKHVWGGYFGKCDWYKGTYNCLCYYGSCHHH